MNITSALDEVLRDVENISAKSNELQGQIVGKIDELEALKERSENVDANIQEYLALLTTIQDSIDEFEDIRDDASNYDIEV